MEKSLEEFCKYNVSDDELFMYIRVNAGEWNEKSFVLMKKLCRAVMNDYINRDYYPKVFVRYFTMNIPSVINILSNIRGISDKAIREGYTKDSYLEMIAERRNQLQDLYLEFQHSLFE